MTFVAYAVVALPLAIALGFAAGLGLPGLWWGLAAGLAFCLIAYIIIIYRFDWPLEVRPWHTCPSCA
jgi:Na+-driven multidrug efflux pump